MPTFFKKLRKFKIKGQVSSTKATSKIDIEEILKRPPQTWNGNDVAALQQSMGNQRVLSMLFDAGLLGNNNKIMVDESEQLEQQEEGKAAEAQQDEETRPIEVNPADLELSLDELRKKLGSQPRVLLATLKAKRALELSQQNVISRIAGNSAKSDISQEIAFLEDLIGQQDAAGLPENEVREVYLQLEDFHQKLESLSDDPNARFEAVKKVYQRIIAYPEAVRRHFPPMHMVFPERTFYALEETTSFQTLLMNPQLLVKLLGPQGIMRWFREMGRPEGL